jgi:hypothetical protein
MNHCRDEQNNPICLDCVAQDKGTGDLANAVNASDHAVKCASCGKDIPTIMLRKSNEDLGIRGSLNGLRPFSLLKRS